MVVPTFVLDSERRVVLWNKAVEDLTGLSASRVLQTQDHWRAFYDSARPCLADLLFEGTAADATALYAAVQANGGVQSRARKAENWCTMPALGRKRYLLLDASAIVDDRGRLVAVVETLRDMTAEQEAKIALKTERDEQAHTIASQVEKACGSLGQALSALSEGDLTYRIAAKLPGAIDQLRETFNAAADRLRAVLRDTKDAAATIRGGSDEIAATADDMARRTERQAASLAETAAALARIMVTVTKTADGAIHASSVVASTKADVEQSGQVVRDAVVTMSGVAASSTKITQIIGVIDEIAFQTNLLALNAGVEAARAGEAGRGFAVVASEVRALAQRSAEAAKEIKRLIAESAAHVERGVTLVGRTGEALSGIVKRIADINHVVADIAASAREQATGLAEINTAVADMDQVTQQNAGVVNAAASVSHDLVRQTVELDGLMGRFTIEPGRTRSRAAA